MKIQDLQGKRRDAFSETGGRVIVILFFNILGLVRVKPNWLDNLEKQEVDRERPYCLYIKEEIVEKEEKLKVAQVFFVETKFMCWPKVTAGSRKT